MSLNRERQVGFTSAPSSAAVILNVVSPVSLEIPCKRKQRYVGSQLSFTFERKRIMLAEVTCGLTGRYADGRLDER